MLPVFLFRMARVIRKGRNNVSTSKTKVDYCRFYQEFFISESSELGMCVIVCMIFFHFIYRLGRLPRWRRMALDRQKKNDLKDLSIDMGE